MTGDTSKDYADGVRASIRIADGGPIDEYVGEVWDISGGRGGLIDRDQLAADIENLAWAGLADDEAPLAYALDTSYRKTEWGASAAFFEVVLYLAAGGIVGGAAWDATKVVARKWASRFKAESGDYDPFPLGEREAIERARWLICDRFKETDADLELLSVDLRPPDKASACFRSAALWDYQCELSYVDGVVVLTRITRGRSDL